MAHKLTLSISQLNEYIRRVVQQDPMLHGLSIRGEISNLKLHQTGTLFFTLKDEDAAISCVMYPQAVQGLAFAPFDGMKVTAAGSIGYYTRGGQLQFYADSLQTQGVGALYERLMALKAKLLQEGLFDKENKKPIPEFVNTIGVVSSPTGAVIHDILSVALRRDPQARILLCPVRVQGIGATDEVVQAISLLERMSDVSVIIVARGGGSIENLWTFNEEAVVRAVAGCSKPVVSAVGHETDVTLCDLAADMRAPTPSAAAECVVVERAERLARMDQLEQKLAQMMCQRMEAEARRLDFISLRLSSMHPGRVLESEEKRLKGLEKQLEDAALRRIAQEEQRAEQAATALELLNPFRVLSRGYAIVRRQERVISGAAQAATGDILTIQMHDGSIHAGVIDREE
ncbi:MAG: exodeoxyribonuclease VII large subunit [Clostridia bacterium]|nr:exodeoxyribonuclease VII large subunit [Clostridia bacterium]